jgi:hypothetical protein
MIAVLNSVKNTKPKGKTMKINLAPIQAQIASLEAVGADKADPGAWMELITAYNAALAQNEKFAAEYAAATDPASPRGEKLSITELLALGREFAVVSQTFINVGQMAFALLGQFLPAKAV